MELLVVRHAIAFERDRERWPDDDARPLSPSGIRLSRKAAAGLKAFSGRPDRLLTSPLTRAQQTARILTDVAGWPRAEVVPELAPDGTPSAVLALLSKERGKRIALVGHQPALGALLCACLLENNEVLRVDLKKNAVACVSFDGLPHAGRAVLQWIATPRMLRRLRHD